MKILRSKQGLRVWEEGRGSTKCKRRRRRSFVKNFGTKQGLTRRLKWKQ
jgi:hypothetical protein